MDYSALYRQYNTKGRIAWQYKPFRNYRLTKDDLEKGEKKYQLVDFDTEELGFKVTNPVLMLALPSYDGSVNLIINDGINIPRLINSRFSMTGNDTYSIEDRNGNDDTNIYDLGVLFDIDTSLYKRLNKIQKIEFLGTSSGGLLKVGNYHFYFKLMDADGNESDFIGLSQLVSIFIGNSPSSAHTGTRDLNSFKIVQFLISNIDVAYPYVSVYYSRATAESTEELVVNYKHILKKYLVTNAGTATIVITGFENEEDVAEQDLNIFYNIIDSAKTTVSNLNMLFLGNVHKSEIPYSKLTNLSLLFCPKIVKKPYNPKINILSNYNISSKYKGYYDVKNIYNEVGYWPGEYYRFGIVYILKSGELSPVFNIRGGLNIRSDSEYNNIDPFELEFDDPNNPEIKIIKYNETYYNLITEESTGDVEFENNKGVISISRLCENNDSDLQILGIQVNLNNYEKVLPELKKYCKGFFFVRLKRIPTVLCQGLSIGIESESHLPMLPVKNDGILKKATSNYSKQHLCFDLQNNSNYITEGFLTHYTFKFKKKKGSLFGKILSGIAIGVGVALLAVGTVVTCGALGVAVAGITVIGATASATLATIGMLTAIAVAAGAAVGATTMITAAAIEETVLAILQATVGKEFNGWNTKCPSGYEIVEEDNSRLLGGEFHERLIVKNANRVKNKALLCPDYVVNLPYFNCIFTGNEHTLISSKFLPVNRYLLDRKDRHFYNNSYQNLGTGTNIVYSKIIGVPEGVSIVGIDDNKFRSKAGDAEEISKFEYVGNEYKLLNVESSSSEEDIDTEISNSQINSDLARGIYCSYLGLSEEVSSNYIYNIMIPEYSDSNYKKYVLLRAEDNSPFYCITQRYDLNDYNIHSDTNVDFNNNESGVFNIYSGDCYICYFTLRINRNFNSPALPYNDKILDNKTWRNNYDTNSKEKQALINLSDVNAVELGTWVTFLLRSNYNLNIRTLDESNVDEVSMCGHARGYYPYYEMNTSGDYKISESQTYNKGFSKSVGELYHFEVPDVPWIKNWFGTRIMYSDVHITDAFRNGFRVFKPTNYRDYTREYGTITKLLSLGSYLIAVMEHGILKIQVTPENHTVDSMINYKNVLSLEPLVVSKDYGSEWVDSIIQTPNGIYGVDTHAKKIWKTDGLNIELISEGTVQRFLNENIKLGEREKTPILGRRNVKTIYNQFKEDIMFTFYNIYENDDLAWNLCYNEKLLKFITFYSWIPSFMENINNIPFSFDRDTSKINSLVYQDDNMIKFVNEKNENILPIIPPPNGDITVVGNLRVDYFEKHYTVNLEIDDKVKYGRYFNINDNVLSYESKYYDTLSKLKIITIPIKMTVQYETSDNFLGIEYPKTIYNTAILFTFQNAYDENKTEFWLHGKSGIFDKFYKLNNEIKPTYWYDLQHPFEFEFVVADNLEYLKIFDNIELIANKAEPESFHYEITGDCYDFSNDKINMYFRQEKLKYLYNYNGSNISYNPDYIYLQSKLHQNKRSADFPKTYYARQDAINLIYDNYVSKDNNNGYNYDHLSGAEIVWYNLENEFRIWNHAKAINLDNLSLEDARSLIAANCKYLEDKWIITINPIVICYKNESEQSWEIKDDNVIRIEPPVAIYNSPFPSDLSNNEIPNDIYNVDYDSWLSDKGIYGTSFGEGLNRKETDVRGRYIKIRIRYSGKELAIIDFIKTIYRISYA